MRTFLRYWSLCFLVTGRHAMPVVIWWSTVSAIDCREHFSLSDVFLTFTSSSWFQDFPGSGQFNLKVTRSSCWCSRHSHGLDIGVNDNNPQKRYGGRFYLRVTAGQLRNEESASYGIWTRFIKGDHARSLMLYPFVQTVMQCEINQSSSVCRNLCFRSF